MPALLGDVDDAVGGLSGEYYMFTDYVWLIVIILVTVMFFVTIISVLSTLAKSVKEASTLVMPLMIVVMVASFASMYASNAKEEIYWYFIPIYNSIQSMIGIFSFSIAPVNMAAAIMSNIAFTLIGLVVLTKLFGSEKVMFSK